MGGCGCSDKVLVCFRLYILRLPFLDKLFELCLFMQTVIPDMKITLKVYS